MYAKLNDYETNKKIPLNKSPYAMARHTAEWVEIRELKSLGLLEEK